MKPLHSSILTSCLVCALALAAGCQKDPVEVAPKSGTDTPPAMGSAAPESDSKKPDMQANNAGPTTNDIEITAKVRSELIVAPELKSAQIGIETNDGFVTLTGTVATQGSMDLAVRLAQTVSGVKAVRNQLQVKAVG